MREVEVFWYILLTLFTLYAFTRWREGIFIGIAIDFLRDPMRKLAPDQPVLVTLSGAAFWGSLILTIFLTEPRISRNMLRTYPRLNTGLLLLYLAVVPAAALSIASYTGGWKLAVIGTISYLLPVLGVVAGFGIADSDVTVYKILRWYLVINALALVSVPIEFMNINIPALGGIKYHWIRYNGNETIDLMSGWYRSPDIMGLHAAHVIMFGMLLAARSKNETQLLWLATALWAAFCVLLSGRRKMIGIPMVFLAAYLILGTGLQVRRISRLFGFFVGATICIAALVLLQWDMQEYTQYTDYAGTMFTSEGADRTRFAILLSAISTIEQNGILGAGLGAGTQGRYYVATTENMPHAWQEDGVSRLLLEFGIPGALLLVAALWQLLRSFHRSLVRARPQSLEQLTQIGLLSIVAGDLASFAVSHQQFSGDPVNGMFVTVIAGMALAIGTASYTVPIDVDPRRQPGTQT